MTDFPQWSPRLVVTYQLWLASWAKGLSPLAAAAVTSAAGLFAVGDGSGELVPQPWR